MSDDYKIKPLNWKPYDNGSIFKNDIVLLHVVRVEENEWLWFAAVQHYQATRMRASSEGSAKLAAEEWYRSKLLQALSPCCLESKEG